MTLQHENIKQKSKNLWIYIVGLAQRNETETKNTNKLINLEIKCTNFYNVPFNDCFRFYGFSSKFSRRYEIPNETKQIITLWTTLDIFVNGFAFKLFIFFRFLFLFIKFFVYNLINSEFINYFIGRLNLREFVERKETKNAQVRRKQKINQLATTTILSQSA